jgi:hypothetical protein
LSFLQENIQQKSGKTSFEVHIKANPEDGSHVPIASCNRAYFATLASRGLQGATLTFCDDCGRIMARCSQEVIQRIEMVHPLIFEGFSAISSGAYPSTTSLH